MKTFVVGCNYRTAPVSIREKLAFDEERIIRALSSFRKTHDAAEMIILSTCNRTEMYLSRPVHSKPQAGVSSSVEGWPAVPTSP